MLVKIRQNLKGKMRIFDINPKKIKIAQNELANINTVEDLNGLRR
jgi:hypothetical protein